MTESTAGRDPIRLFRRWFRQAERAELLEPEAVALATATPDGKPSVRFVLVKGVDPRGFVFYTSYVGRKARELEANPHAAFAIYWDRLERQVRVEGTVERVTPEESDAYFATRPLVSRLGAWASRQSRVIADRRALERRLARVKRRFRTGDPPRPPFWGGYRLVPERVELWQGRPNRLHDRILFERTRNGWKRTRLSP